jgi:TorA maturation chaperone TorD
VPHNSTFSNLTSPNKSSPRSLTAAINEDSSSRYNEPRSYFSKLEVQHTTHMENPNKKELRTKFNHCFIETTRKKVPKLGS